MQVIWNSQNPVTSNYILNELKEQRKWQLSTLMTSLKRLSDKGFVNCDRSTGNNLYSFLIPENEYKISESKNFLKNFITTLYKIWLLPYITIKQSKILI